MKYHTPENSFYVVLKIRYRGKDYVKARVFYHYKTSSIKFYEENLRIPLKVIERWTRWVDNNS